MKDREFLTVKQVADTLQVTTRTIFNYFKSGYLKKIKLKGKNLIRKSEFERFIKEREGK
ncbi:MAG: helix-turn-helix domain-containing protein [Candidatus Marinimicrobia bacterium]|nr:helix-turn-helix domain-containing protein [Candidatus Neomarinimicrobiota bacterium]